MRVEPTAGPGKLAFHETAAPSPRRNGALATGCSPGPVTGGSACTPGRVVFRVRSQRAFKSNAEGRERFCLNSKVPPRFTRRFGLFFSLPLFFRLRAHTAVHTQVSWSQSGLAPLPPKGVRFTRRQAGAKHARLSGPPCEHGCTVPITNHSVWGIYEMAQDRIQMKNKNVPAETRRGGTR